MFECLIPQTARLRAIGRQTEEIGSSILTPHSKHRGTEPDDLGKAVVLEARRRRATVLEGHDAEGAQLAHDEDLRIGAPTSAQLRERRPHAVGAGRDRLEEHLGQGVDVALEAEGEAGQLGHELGAGHVGGLGEGRPNRYHARLEGAAQVEHYFVPPRHEAVRYFDQRVRVALGWESCEEEDGLLFGLRGCHDDDGGGVCFCSSVLGKCLSI